MSDDPTPEQLEALAAEHERRAARLRAAAEVLRAAEVGYARAVKAAHEKSGIINRVMIQDEKMPTATIENVPGRGQPIGTPDHPFVKALEKRGLSLSAWCREKKRAPQLMSARVAGKRGVPPHEAKWIAEQFEDGEVPAWAWAKPGKPGPQTTTRPRKRR